MVSSMSEYEKLRARNIAENKRMLESLGLLRAFKPILEPIKKKKARVAPKVSQGVKRKYDEIKVSYSPATTLTDDGEGTPVRRSLRVRKMVPAGGSLKLPSDDELDDDDYEVRKVQKKKPPKVKRDNTFGAIEGVAVGTHWDTRLQCSADGVHRPTVAGIHGNEQQGCYSIALSGGYEDDLDLGDSFTYTGSGGRDLKGTAQNPKNLRTAAQSKDQILERGNLALSRNVENRQPVRVLRGYKCPSAFAPEYGYRYDGLYSVEKYWSAVGMSGFRVWKFILKRLPDQEPPPWKESLVGIQEEEEDDVSSGDSEEKPVVYEEFSGDEDQDQEEGKEEGEKEEVEEEVEKEEVEEEEVEEEEKKENDIDKEVKEEEESGKVMDHDEDEEEEDEESGRNIKRRKGDI